MNTQKPASSILLPAWLRTGNSDSDQALQSLGDLHAALIQATQECLRNIRIHTPDLDQDLYDHEDFLSALTGFVRGNRLARIQILVQDSRDAITRGHGLIRLAQRLTSSIEIRKPAGDDAFTPHSFVIFDNSGFLYREQGRNSGVYNPQCPFRVNRLLDMFTPAWEQAEQDMNTRRLSI